MSMLWWGSGLDDEDEKAKNVRQTELLVDLREAILLIARHFQSLDPSNCIMVRLIACLLVCLSWYILLNCFLHIVDHFQSIRFCDHLMLSETIVMEVFLDKTCCSKKYSVSAAYIPGVNMVVMKLRCIRRTLLVGDIPDLRRCSFCLCW